MKCKVGIGVGVRVCGGGVLRAGRSRVRAMALEAGGLCSWWVVDVPQASAPLTCTLPSVISHTRFVIDS